MSVDSPEQLEALRRVGRLVAETIAHLREAVRPGLSTGALDRMAAEFLSARGARSGPILTYGYPGWTCISVEEQVVHGVPSEARVLRSGEVVTLDVAIELDGYHADAATTVAVGTIDRRHAKLIAATRSALTAGVRAAQPGATLRDVGAAVERAARARGYRVFRELTGHGIGRRMHEPPTVFNWPAPQPEAELALHAGLVLTIEPMLTTGRTRLVTEADGWTVSALDGSPSAHEEHTIMVADGGPVVLTRH
jgi:methionyl aminopeptidase